MHAAEHRLVLPAALLLLGRLLVMLQVLQAPALLALRRAALPVHSQGHGWALTLPGWPLLLAQAQVLCQAVAEAPRAQVAARAVTSPALVHARAADCWACLGWDWLC